MRGYDDRRTRDPTNGDVFGCCDQLLAWQRKPYGQNFLKHIGFLLPKQQSVKTKDDYYQNDQKLVALKYTQLQRCFILMNGRVAMTTSNGQERSIGDCLFLRVISFKAGTARLTRQRRGNDCRHMSSG